MSDAALTIIVPSIVSTIGLVIIAWLNTRQIRQSKKEIVSKVDDYHKEVNGKMGELLDTTKALGRAEGKAEEKSNKEK